jgi:hypothetical protein
MCNFIGDGDLLDFVTTIYKKEAKNLMGSENDSSGYDERVEI